MRVRGWGWVGVRARVRFRVRFRVRARFRVRGPPTECRLRVVAASA